MTNAFQLSRYETWELDAMVSQIERPNPWPGRFGFHEIWHCCVVIGAGCHFAAMCLCI